MSLRSAVEEIVGDMGHTSKTIPLESVKNHLDGYIKMLKMALKASEGETVAQLAPQSYVDPDILHRAAIEKLKDPGKSMLKEEHDSVTMLTIHGGPADGSMHCVPEIMPLDAYTAVGNGVYQRKKDGLHYQHDLKGNA